MEGSTTYVSEMSMPGVFKHVVLFGFQRTSKAKVAKLIVRPPYEKLTEPAGW